MRWHRRSSWFPTGAAPAPASRRVCVANSHRSEGRRRGTGRSTPAPPRSRPADHARPGHRCARTGQRCGRQPATAVCVGQLRLRTADRAACRGAQSDPRARSARIGLVTQRTTTAQRHTPVLVDGQDLPLHCAQIELLRFSTGSRRRMHRHAGSAARPASGAPTGSATTKHAAPSTQHQGL